MLNPKKQKLNLNKFDYCIDTAGTIKTIEKSFNLINNKGLCIFCSHPEFKKKIKLKPLDLISGKKIVGSWGGNTNPDKDIALYNDLLLKIKVNLNNFFNKFYTLTNINKAIDDFKTGKVLRPIIQINNRL